MPYFVVGGQYRDTTFQELVQPDRTAGPFEHYLDALVSWRGRSMAHVDEAFARYIIVQADTVTDAERQSLAEPVRESAQA